jgi:TatA/E family protein of Tat protein translocase
MFDLGIQELIVIFIVALLVFGPKRLPELGKTLGKGILELRKAMEGIKEQMKEESDALKTMDDRHEPEGKKEGTLPASDDASSLVEGPPGFDKEKDKTDAPAVGDTTVPKAAETGKEDKVDGR